MLQTNLRSDSSDLADRTCIASLVRKCRTMRRQALAGHWSYDLALLRNLLTVLDAERVALSATESLPVSPDGRRLRAA